MAGFFPIVTKIGKIPEKLKKKPPNWKKVANWKKSLKSRDRQTPLVMIDSSQFLIMK